MPVSFLTCFFVITLCVRVAGALAASYIAAPSNTVVVTSYMRLFKLHTVTFAIMLVFEVKICSNRLMY